MAGRLTDEEITKALNSLPGWTREGDEIRKQYTFPDFRGSIAFVISVADLAEAANHHPDIAINYNKVSLALTSHDARGLTERDTSLASEIDRTALT